MYIVFSTPYFYVNLIKFEIFFNIFKFKINGGCESSL